MRRKPWRAGGQRHPSVFSALTRMHRIRGNHRAIGWPDREVSNNRIAIEAILGFYIDRITRLEFVEVVEGRAVSGAVARDGKVADFTGQLAFGVVSGAELV